MNIIFLGSLYPRERYNEILIKSKYVDIAGNVLQWNFLSGFDLIAEVQVLTVPAIKGYEGLIFKGSSFFHKINSLDYCIGFVDIIGLKQLTSSISVLKKCNQLISYNDHIIIYSIQSHLLKAAVDLKKRHPNVKISLIVTDLPQYMSDNKNLIYTFLKRINSAIINKKLKYVDSYILLSKYMVEKLPIGNKPYTIIEGIYNNTDDINLQVQKDVVKKIFYSGTLARQYGIINLVKAFELLNNDNYRLIICGEGDAKDEIIRAASKDGRIIYKGLLSHNEVLVVQKQSNLLVNPRTPDAEYTKYSFPSKTIEYLASGVPTLLYKLPGIPEEYYEYCFTIDTYGINPLANKIDEILKTSDEKLEQVGIKAREFITTQKNPQLQCSKIIDMIEKL